MLLVLFGLVMLLVWRLKEFLEKQVVGNDHIE